MAVWDECDGDIGPGQPEAAIPENPEPRDDPGLAAENLLEGQNRRLQHGRKGGATTRKQPQRHTGVKYVYFTTSSTTSLSSFFTFLCSTPTRTARTTHRVRVCWTNKR